MRILFTATLASLSLARIVSKRWPGCFLLPVFSILLSTPLNCMLHPTPFQDSGATLRFGRDLLKAST